MVQNCTSLKILLSYVFTSRKNYYHLFRGTFFSYFFLFSSFSFLPFFVTFQHCGRWRIAWAVGYFHLIIFFRSKVSANRKYLFCECKHAEYFLFKPRNTYHFTFLLFYTIPLNPSHCTTLFKRRMRQQHVRTRRKCDHEM